LKKKIKCFITLVILVDSDVYKFKSSFNPEVEDMPDYYTFISNKWATSILEH
jgi:hypothetical protein